MSSEQNIEEEIELSGKYILSYGSKNQRKLTISIDMILSFLSGLDNIQIISLLSRLSKLLEKFDKKTIRNKSLYNKFYAWLLNGIHNDRHNDIINEIDSLIDDIGKQRFMLLKDCKVMKKLREKLLNNIYELTADISKGKDIISNKLIMTEKSIVNNHDDNPSFFQNRVNELSNLILNAIQIHMQIDDHIHYNESLIDKINIVSEKLIPSWKKCVHTLLKKEWPGKLNSKDSYDIAITIDKIQDSIKSLISPDIKETI